MIMDINLIVDYFDYNNDGDVDLDNDDHYYYDYLLMDIVDEYLDYVEIISMIVAKHYDELTLQN